MINKFIARFYKSTLAALVVSYVGMGVSVAYESPLLSALFMFLAILVMFTLARVFRAERKYPR